MNNRNLKLRLIELKIITCMVEKSPKITFKIVLFVSIFLLHFNLSTPAFAQYDFSHAIEIKDGAVYRNILGGFPEDKFGFVWDSIIYEYDFQAWEYPHAASFYKYNNRLYQVDDLDRLIDELFGRLLLNEIPIDIKAIKKINRYGFSSCNIENESFFNNCYKYDNNFKSIIDDINRLSEDDEYDFLTPNAYSSVNLKSDKYKKVDNIQQSIQTLDSYRKMLVAFYFLADHFELNNFSAYLNPDVYNFTNMIANSNQILKLWDTNPFKSIEKSTDYINEINANCLSFSDSAISAKSEYRLNQLLEYEWHYDWISFIKIFDDRYNAELHFNVNQTQTSFEFQKQKETDKKYIIAKSFELLGDYCNNFGKDQNALEYYYKAINSISKSNYLIEQGILEEKIGDFFSNKRIMKSEFNSHNALAHYRIAAEKFHMAGERLHEENVKYKATLVQINTLSSRNLESIYRFTVEPLKEFLKAGINGLIADWDDRLSCQNKYYLYLTFGNYFKFKDDERDHKTALQYYQKSIISAMKDLENYDLSEIYDALDNMIVINDTLGHKEQMKHYHDLKIQLISKVAKCIEENTRYASVISIANDTLYRDWIQIPTFPRDLGSGKEPKGFVNFSYPIGSYSRDHFNETESQYYKELFKYEGKKELLTLSKYYEDLIDRDLISYSTEEVNKLNHLENFYSTSNLINDFNRISNELDSLRIEYERLQNRNKKLFEENKKKIIENSELNKTNGLLKTSNNVLSAVQKTLLNKNDSIIRSNDSILGSNRKILQSNVSLNNQMRIANTNIKEINEAAGDANKRKVKAEGNVRNLTGVIFGLIILGLLLLYGFLRRVMDLQKRAAVAKDELKQNRNENNIISSQLRQAIDAIYVLASKEIIRKDEIIKLNKLIIKSNTLSAISQLFARTDSHDLGHVLDAYKSISDFRQDEIYDGQYYPDGPIRRPNTQTVAEGKKLPPLTDQLNSRFGAYVQYPKTDKVLINDEPVFSFYPNLIATFNQYLKTRMDYRADIATGNANSLTTLDYYHEVFLPFHNNRIFNNRISGVSDKDLKYKIQSLYREDTNKDISLQLALPNDVLGCHALYIIWSNIIRNTVKHAKLSEKENGNLQIINHFSDYDKNPDYYELSIYTNVYRDAEGMKALVEKRNKAFDDKIFDSEEQGRMRDNNLGSIEMAACAAYLRLMDVTEIENDDYNLYTDGQLDVDPRGANNIPVFIYAFPQANESEQCSLGYKLYLLKPKEVLIVCEGIGAMAESLIAGSTKLELSRAGVDIITPEQLKVAKVKAYNNKLLLFYGDEKSYTHFKEMVKEENLVAGLPKRIIQASKVESFTNEKSFKKWCWGQWVGKYNCEYIVNRIDNKAVNAIIGARQRRKEIKLYNHDEGIENAALTNGDYHEMCCSHHWLTRNVPSTLTKEENREKFYQYIEAVETRVMVIDERLQKSIVLQDRQYADHVSFKEYFRQQGILIPEPEKDEPNLNATNLEAEKERIKSFVQSEIGNLNFVVLHLGLLEKLTGDEKAAEKSKEMMDAIINELINGETNRNKVVITTGRGKAVNISEDLSFLPISLLQNALETTFDKYRLVQILYNSRKSI